MKYNKQWFIAKKQVDEFPSNFESVITNYERNKQDSIHYSTSGKYKKIVVDLKDINGFEAKLFVYMTKSKEVKTAWYSIFNNEDGVVYKRVLTGKEFYKDVKKSLF